MCKVWAWLLVEERERCSGLDMAGNGRALLDSLTESQMEWLQTKERYSLMGLEAKRPAITPH